MIASQNIGMERPITVRMLTPLSIHVPRLIAAAVPITMPITTESTRVNEARRRV